MSDDHTDNYDEEKIRRKSEYHYLRRRIESYMSAYDTSDNIETTNRLKFKIEAEKVRALTRIAIVLESINRREDGKPHIVIMEDK